MNKKQQNRYSRCVSVLLTGMLVASICSISQAEQVRAAEPANEIEVSVGYYGAKNYTKKTIRFDELDDRLITSQQIYTWINEDQKCGTTEAEGIYLSDLLNYADVDMDSVYSYEFLPQEQSSESEENREWREQELFEGTEGDRYSFARVFQIAEEAYEDCENADDYLNNPEEYFTVEDFFDFDSTHVFKDIAWNYRTAVNPMLALKTRTEIWEKGALPPTKLDFSVLEAEEAPVLRVGQASKDDVVDLEEVQQVTQVNIWFEGSPQITVDTKDLNGEAGSKGSISVRVSTPDQTLTNIIRSEIRFASSNSSVAAVDHKGNVEIKGEGTASITVSYDSDGDGIAETVGTTAVTGTAKADNSGGGTNNSSSGGANSSTSGGGSNSSSGASNNSNTGSSGSGQNSDSTSGSGSTGNNTGSQGINHSGDSNGQDSSRTTTGSQAVNFTPQRTTVTNTTPRTFTSAQPAEQTSPSATVNGDETADANEYGVRSIAEAGDDYDDVNPYAPDGNAPEGNVSEGTGNVLSVNAVDNLSGQSVSSTASRKTVVLSLLAGAIAVICGMILSTWNYWNQTEWVDRAKKLFEKQG